MQEPSQSNENKTLHVPLVEDSNSQTPAQSKVASTITPMVLLMFMIFGVLIVIAITILKQNGTFSSLTEDPNLTALKAGVEASRSELNRQRIAMGLSPLTDGSEDVEDIVKRLKSDADLLVGITKKFQEMLVEKDGIIALRDKETLRLEKLRQDISQENARLQSELQRALLASADSDRLKLALSDAQMQRDELIRQLATAKEELKAFAGSVNNEDYLALKRQYDEVLRAKEFNEARLKELEAAAQNNDLFADSENELLPAAVELFRRLRRLEGLKDSDLTTEYSKLGVELGANVLHTLNFATGSSELISKDKEIIQQVVLNEVPDGDLTLIIGYASETGNSEANQTLSSDRATTAAEYYASNKRPGQKVQAVYLGQTDRFSSRIPERNQICEIWRIRKK